MREIRVANKIVTLIILQYKIFKIMKIHKQFFQHLFKSKFYVIFFLSIASLNAQEVKKTYVTQNTSGISKKISKGTITYATQSKSSDTFFIGCKLASSDTTYGKGFLAFDISTIPQDAKITKVSLNLATYISFASNYGGAFYIEKTIHNSTGTETDWNNFTKESGNLSNRIMECTINREGDGFLFHPDLLKDYVASKLKDKTVFIKLTHKNETSKIMYFYPTNENLYLEICYIPKVTFTNYPKFINYGVSQTVIFTVTSVLNAKYNWKLPIGYTLYKGQANPDWLISESNGVIVTKTNTISIVIDPCSKVFPPISAQVQVGNEANEWTLSPLSEIKNIPEIDGNSEIDHYFQQTYSLNGNSSVSNIRWEGENMRIISEQGSKTIQIVPINEGKGKVKVIFDLPECKNIQITKDIDIINKATISGPSVVCGGAYFTLNNLPSNITVKWSIPSFCMFPHASHSTSNPTFVASPQDNGQMPINAKVSIPHYTEPIYFMIKPWYNLPGGGISLYIDSYYEDNMYAYTTVKYNKLSNIADGIQGCQWEITGSDNNISFSFTSETMARVRISKGISRAYGLLAFPRNQCGFQQWPLTIDVSNTPPPGLRSSTSLIIETGQEELLNIYPNPIENILYVEGDYSKIEIFDQNGKMCIISKTSPINVSALKSGIYFIRIYNTDKFITKTITKK
jgi:hypothetical protein